MANMFDENGNYNKTEWKPGDRITAGKLNKIEESLEAINNNDIERHKEADERLDALEEQNEAIVERFDELEDLVADKKSEVEVLIYENNVKMDRLEQEMNDGIDTVEAIAHTVDVKIAEADASMKAQVNQGKADMEAMVAEVEGELDGINTQLEQVASMQNFVNVKIFGAKGDGITDDTNAIKEAIEYINNNPTTIYFPKGVYIVTNNFILNNLINYTFIGDSAEIKLTKEYQTKPIDYLFKVEQSDNFKMSGIILNGNNVGNINTKQNYGLYINNTNNCIIENCTFKNFQGNGLYVYLEVKNFVGRNNKYLSNAIHGLNVTNLYNCTIENEVMEGNLGQGFDIVTYGQNYQDLISKYKYKIVNIKNCIVRNNGTGSNESGQPYSSGGKLYGCYLATVENCIFEDNGHETYKGQQLRLCNSNIEENVVNGHILINNCKFKANNLTQKGIADFGECENLTITNCKFNGIYEFPLQIRSKGLIENNEFNCTVDTSGDNGVKIQSSNVVFRNNIFTDIFNCIAVITQIDETIPQAISTSNIVIENNLIKNAKKDYAMFLKNNNSIIQNNIIPDGNRIDLRIGENNIVKNTGTVKNNATNTLYDGYSGDTSYRSYMYWSGSAKIGTQYFNTQTNKLEVWNGSEWI